MCKMLEPQHLESGKQRLLLCEKQVLIDLGVGEMAPVKQVQTFTKGVSPAASGVADFRGVTGGVYKTRERIHRGVLTHGY